MSTFDRTACVYRYFNRDGGLIYIGMSGWPMDRLRAHATQSPFAREVVRVEIEWFDTRDQARAAEIAAIRSEAPEWNIAHCDPRRTRARGETTNLVAEMLAERGAA